MRALNRTERGSRGTNRGRGPTIHCSNCGTTAADPCSEECGLDLADNDYDDDLAHEEAF